MGTDLGAGPESLEEALSPFGADSENAEPVSDARLTDSKAVSTLGADRGRDRGRAVLRLVERHDW